MIRVSSFVLFVTLLSACKPGVPSVKPVLQSITSSVYASGLVKAKGQYQAFASTGGIVDEVFVTEGDLVKKGSPILSIVNSAQRLNAENAELAAVYSDYQANLGKLKEAKAIAELAQSKLANDSILLARQRILWQQDIGSKVELEQRELAFKNAKTAYLSALIKYDDLNRQLHFGAEQAKKNLAISKTIAKDFTLLSEINGKIYSIDKKRGELVGPQSPLAVIGEADAFVLEMQVDEYDILKIKTGLIVYVSLDSYKNQVFQAKVTKINPLMNERSKTFLVEAEFVKEPDVLYPNISFEANIVIDSKDKAMLIPRAYMLNDSMVVKSNGEKVVVQTGLKDYRMVEIRSGLTAADELIAPE